MAPALAIMSLRNMTHVILIGAPDINYRWLKIELRFGQKAFGGDELHCRESSDNFPVNCLPVHTKQAHEK